MTIKPNGASLNLVNTYIHLSANGRADEIVIDGDFRTNADSRKELREGRLMGAVRITTDISHWEMHPEGEEILYLVSGALDVVLQEESGDRTVELRDGGVCIVPRGVWHTQIVHAPSELVFVTPGRGTQHRPA